MNTDELIEEHKKAKKREFSRPISDDAPDEYEKYVELRGELKGQLSVYEEWQQVRVKNSVSGTLDNYLKSQIHKIKEELK